MAEKVRVVVGDDHPLFREGVVRALTSSGEIDVVAEADDGTEALAAIIPGARFVRITSKSVDPLLHAEEFADVLSAFLDETTV